MTIILDGTTGITTPGLINTGTETVVNLTTSGNTTLGDASGDTLTLNGSTVSTPNGLNFDSNTFVIDATNNRVGVGTASPASALDVNGSSILRGTTSILGGGVLDIYNTAGTNYTRSSVDSSGNFYINNTSIAALQFGTNNSERMRIDSSGKVLVGGTTAVYGGGSTRGALEVNGSAESILSLTIGGSTTNSAYIYNNASQLEFYSQGARPIVWSQSGAERMRIDSSGNLLVGTTTKLQDDNKFVVQASGGNGGNGIGIFYNTGIDGSPSLVCSKGSTTTSSSARFIQFYAGGVATTAMGGIVGNGASNVQFASLSDAREKTNIQPISGSLEKVNALNPVEFDWIADGSHVKAGFVAQDVEQVFPEFVIENIANDNEEPRKGLTGGMTGGIVAHLVKAIQEQQAIINDLKARIETLESK